MGWAGHMARTGKKCRQNFVKESSMKGIIKKTKHTQEDNTRMGLEEIEPSCCLCVCVCVCTLPTFEIN
jgi:hypothetical protein